MQEVTTSINKLWPFDLPKIGTWFYFLIIGFPISSILLLVDSLYIPFTDKPIFIDKLSKYSMLYNNHPQQIEYYTRTPSQKVILGFVGYIVGIIILTFSLILSIFGAFKQAAELQESIILLLFPAARKSEHIKETLEMEPKITPDIIEPSKVCPACGENNQKNSEFCINCGSNLPAKNI
ncbi:MAG: hypothetical protein HeimC2_11720 [Candidatus Heimdallarchaeota archaeon LC_2]|nr:MAG: hypothetical protein HeimC2_11720 [Candidatus Heimdallarchaeota archaeon LC_2]